MQLSLFPQNHSSNQEDKSKPITRKLLNDAQHEAVTTTVGPVLVIAGAGSGKTRTLVYRTAYLVEQGVAPEEILLLTFTRKAAQEMINRASSIINDSCRQVMGGTFHAISNLLLRRYCHYLDYAPNFTIIDQSDAEGIVNLLKSSLNFSGAGKKFPSKRVIVNAFSSSVNKDIPLSEIISDRYWHFEEFTDEMIILKEHYSKFKLEHNLMDYDDLLVNLRNVMHGQNVVKQEISERFKYIMVDEYQDTNHIQAEIVRLAAGERQNVMAVGDDAQSIYSFRGANFRNIIEFPKIYKETKIIRLEENYRSIQPILSMSNAIIEKAAEKFTKKLFSKIDGNQKPVVYGARNESDQAKYIVEKIVNLHKDGVELGEIAVLFRSGFHSYRLELELAHNQIVFEKRGGMKLTESAHVKDVISYLRVVSNSADHLSWNRILLHLRKVGPKTVNKILSSIKNSEDPIAALKRYPAGKNWKDGYDKLLEMLSRICQPENLQPVELFELIMEYYQSVLERVYHDDYPTRARDLEQLRSIVAGYDDLQSFIDDSALEPAENLSDIAEKPIGLPPLVLSTVHSAKGLEWDTVFVINLVEGKFPSAKARMAEEVEEERRLLYVAATRAKRRLFMIYPREVMGAERYLEPAIISRFLEEIPGDLTVSPGFTPSKKVYAYKNREVVNKKPASNIGDIAVGCKIKHSFFGEGKVEKCVGARTVEVYFSRHGRKTINLDYAKVVVLG